MSSTKPLPPPQRAGSLSLEAALDQRHSCRDLSSQPLGDQEVGQLLWAAQGISARGQRTVPSAGGLNPLEVYTVSLEGVSHYDPAKHALRRLGTRDIRQDLARAALSQEFIARAPLTIVLCAVQARTARRYGPERGPRYVLMEVGHAAQNVLLQAVALHLGAVPVGAFDDRAVHSLMPIPADHEPLYLLPIGHPLKT